MKAIDKWQILNNMGKHCCYLSVKINTKTNKFWVKTLSLKANWLYIENKTNNFFIKNKKKLIEFQKEAPRVPT